MTATPGEPGVFPSVERWKQIPGFDYEVSNLGRVRSLLRKQWREHSRTGGHWVSYPGVELRAAASKSGHLTVTLGRGKTRQVHALVMLAFVGPRPADQEILHLNHDPGDNRLENLKYGTRSENMKMDYEAGKRTTPPEFIYSNNGRRRQEVVIPRGRGK